MEYSYRIVPEKITTAKIASVKQTASKDYEVHDTFRHGLKSVASDLTEGHPLENHLASFDKTQEQLKMTLMRNNEGVHVPLRLHMENMLLSQPRRNPVIPGSNFSMDILKGRDTDITPEDFMGVPENSVETLDIQNTMLSRIGLGTV